LRTVDKQRLVKKVSKLQGATAKKLMDALAEMFAA
jgi:mRNA-degrading endonuclease toxin of MazEF toxin-antitoxin module